MADHISYRTDGKVGTITIDRPEKRNSMTYRMLRDFIELVGEAGTDDATVVLIITGVPGAFNSGPSQIVMDRLPPAADLELGLAWTPTRRLTVRGTVYNVFNARYFQPDAFFDYEPRLEFLPNPWEDMRAYLSASLSY